ncbi:MAG: diguanylate cyclase [Planctomycetota bacterium]|nr:diguanylate cyclase [Planctomycetota bacterium]
MRIGQRLGLGFGIVLLLMVGMTVVVFLSLNRIGKVREMVTIHSINKKALDVLRGNIEHWLTIEEYLIKERNLSQLDYHEILETQIVKELKEIDWSVYGEAIAVLRIEIDQTFTNIEKLANTVQINIRLGNAMPPDTKDMDNAIDEFEAEASTITDALTTLDEMVNTIYNQTLAFSEKNEKNSRLSIYIAVPAVVIFSTIYAFFITGGITKPLRMLGAATKRIAEGTYDAKLDVKSSVEIEELFVSFKEMSIKLEDSYNKLEELSITDKLTNLYNRRYFDEALEREVLRARRLQHALSLLFIDIDKFKHFNDTYGHPEGDKVLQRLGQIIKERARNGVDVACRYGGEEFVVLLPEIAGRGAIAVATRMLRDFGNTKFFIQPNDETVQKTISIGIAELGLSTDVKALLANADSAMYEAKKSGGNTVCLHHKA